MRFGGADGNRLMTMGKWALNVRRQLYDGILCSQVSAFCTRFIQEGINRVKSVIAMRAGDTRGKKPQRQWEEDWFGGFLWLHDVYSMSDEEARAFYFSEELMQFWSNVMDVANRADSTVYGEEIALKVQNLEMTMKTEDSMLDLKRLMDLWAKDTLERSPLFRAAERNKKRASSTQSEHCLGQKLRRIPEEGDASINEVLRETDQGSIPVYRGKRKKIADEASNNRARKLVYEQTKEKIEEGMGHVQSDEEGAGVNSEVDDNASETTGFSTGAVHEDSSEIRGVRTLPCD